MSEIIIHMARTDYHGGDDLSGIVEVKLTAGEPVRAVRIRFEGLESWRWSSFDEGELTNNLETHHFFDEQVTLFGEEPLAAHGHPTDRMCERHEVSLSPDMPAGSHLYPFAYTLPEQLPGDYVSRYGDAKIHYKVSAWAELDRSPGLATIQSLTVYELDAAIDFAAITLEREAVYQPDEDSYAKVRVTVARPLYLPGSVVHLKLEFDNQTHDSIEGAGVALRLCETVMADGSTIERLDMIDAKELQGCAVGSGERAERFAEYTLPGDLYPTLASSQLIRVEYLLTITVDAPWGDETLIELPLWLTEQPGIPGGVGDL